MHLAGRIKNKRERRKKKRDSKSSSVTYGITHFRFRPVHASVHQSARLALALAVTQHLTPRHPLAPSPLRATLRQGFCNFLCWRSEQIKNHLKIKKFLLYFALFVRRLCLIFLLIHILSLLFINFARAKFL